MLKATTELLKNEHVLTVVGIKWVLIIGDTVAIRIAIFIHHRTGLAGAGFAKHIGHFHITPGGSKFSVTVHGTDALNFINLLISAGNGIHNFHIACTVFKHVHNNIGISAFTLMLLGHLTFFLEGIREIYAVVVFAACIRIVIGAVRLFIELLTIFQNISTVFSASTVHPLTVEIREQFIDTFSGAGIAEHEKNVGMPGLALITFFIAKAEIKQAFKLVECGFYLLMVKTMFLGVIYRNLPLATLHTGHAVSHFQHHPKKLQNYKSRGRVILGLPRPAGLRPAGFTRDRKGWRTSAEKDAPIAQAAGIAPLWAIIRAWAVYIQMRQTHSASPGRGDALECDNIAAIVKFDVIFRANGNTVIRIMSRVKRLGESGLTLHAERRAEIMNLIEIVIPACFPALTFQMGLANNFDFHFLFLLF